MFKPIKEIVRSNINHLEEEQNLSGITVIGELSKLFPGKDIKKYIANMYIKKGLLLLYTKNKSFAYEVAMQKNYLEKKLKKEIRVY